MGHDAGIIRLWSVQWGYPDRQFWERWINAFDSDGNFLGALKDANGKAIKIDGLWTLTLGGGRNSSSDTLFFTAGPNDETDGLFGTITPVSKKSDDDRVQ